MHETGKVVSTSGERAEVEVAARGECEHCSAHGICNWTGTSVRKVLVVNKARAVVDDLVELEMTEGTGARTNLLVFGIPVMFMFAGVLIGGLVIRKDLWSGILGGVGLAIGFGIVKAIDIAVNRSGSRLPTIVRRLSADEITKQGTECGSHNQGDTDENAGIGSAGRSPDNGVR